MKHLLVIGFILSLSCNIFAQIDMNDSTAQVIGYWNLNEQQSYVLTKEKYKIKDSDTTSREFIKYYIDIKVVDSTANSYIIDWSYRDFEITSDNEIMNKLASVNEDITIRIRTDELGVLQEVINWEEIRKHSLKVLDLLKEELKVIPNIDKFIQQLQDIYSTKESIEAGLIAEIHQFYFFHGVKYKFDTEYTNDTKSPNLYGGEPFDTKVTYWLDEVNTDDNNIVLRMHQSIDSTQLTEAAYKQVRNMFETLEVETPNMDNAPMLTNDIYTASRIHGSGWVIYTSQIKEVKAEGSSSFEERIIEII